MKIAFFALFITVIFLIMFGFSRAIVAMCYDKRYRYYHIRIVFGTVITYLVLTNVWSASIFINFLDRLINDPRLAAFFEMVMPNRAYSLVYMLLMLLGLNLIAGLVALLLASVIPLIFSWQKKYLYYGEYTGLGRIIHFPWLIVNAFYDGDEGGARLNAKGYSFGKWVKGIKMVMALLWGIQTVILAASILWGKESWNTLLTTVSKAWYLMPMASYFIFQQIQLFLEGTFYNEAGGFSSAKISTLLKADMETLLQCYQHHFQRSGALLLSEYRKEKQLSGGLEGNRLGNRQIRDCRQRELLEVVANQIKQSDLHMNDTYKNALVALFNGESVNICDRCEGEYLLYLCAYLNFYISQGKTVLVLCTSAQRTRQVTDALRGGMNRLNELCSVWNICTLEDAEDHDRVHILVCTADEFIRYNAAKRRKEFFDDLFCAVLTDGGELVAQDCLRAHRLFSTLRGLPEMAQYILFTDGNNDSLRTYVERMIQKEVLPFGHDVLCPETGIMVWGEESAYRIQRQMGVGDTISHYMGTAVPLAVLAAKYDIDKVHIVEESTRADHSYMDVLTESRGEVARFVGRNANLQSMIRTDDSEILGNPDNKVIIAYDTRYNFYQTFWRWAKYGGKQKMLIHIISPSYMLREYFVEKYHSNQMLWRKNDFDAIVSYHQGMKATRMAVFLTTLCEESLTEEELMKKSREYGWHYQTVAELLEDCLRVVLTDHEIHSIYSVFLFRQERVFVPEKDTFETQTYITLTDDGIRARLTEKIRLAQLVTQNNQRSDLGILAGNVYNYYLRDQVVPINGYFYQISKVVNGNIHAEQKTNAELPEYMQLSDFVFSDYTRVDAGVDTDCLDVNLCNANVERKIYGYWETTNGNRFGAGQGPLLHDLRGDGDGLSVTYDNVGVLELNIARSALGNQPVETVRLFAYALKELFCTLFPYTHKNLFVALREEDGTSFAKKVVTPGTHSLEEKVASLIPTVAPGFDTPAADRITLYVVEASCLEYGMVQMLYERRLDVFRMLREYLQWYQAPGEATEEAAESGSQIRGSYLHFGCPEIPNVFSLSGLTELCNRLVPVTEAPEADVESDVAPENVQVCSFCGAETMMPQELQEGDIRRLMCRDCHDHQLTAEQEVNDLYAGVFDSMQRDFGISLPNKLMVRFQTATAIAKFTGVGGNGGRVLGFYYHSGRELWLESRGPEVALCSTMIHELTHAWQYHDRSFTDTLHDALRTFKRKYRKLVRLLLVEGHAMYVEIDGMQGLHELVYADRLRRSTEKRNDEYGVGYLFVREYIDEYRTEGSHVTPFVAMLRLLEAIADRKEAQERLQELVETLLG